MPELAATDPDRRFGRSSKAMIMHSDLANEPEAGAVSPSFEQILEDALRLVTDVQRQVPALMILLDAVTVADLLAGLSKLEHSVGRLGEHTSRLRAAIRAEDA